MGVETKVMSWLTVPNREDAAMVPVSTLAPPPITVMKALAM